MSLLALLLATCLNLLPAAPEEPGEVSLLTDIVAAPGGDLYVADAGRRRILCVSEHWDEPETVVTFDADAPIRWPARLAFGDDGALYVSDPRTHSVARVDVDDGRFEIVAGTGRAGFDRDGVATLVPLSHPAGMVVRDGRLVIADLGNRAVRAVDLERGTITTLAGGWDATHTVMRDGFFSAPERFLPVDVDVAPDGSLRILDLAARCVLTLDDETGALTEVEGSINLVDSGRPGVDQRVAARRSFAIDGAGALVFAEGPAARVMRLVPGEAAPAPLCERELRWPSAVAVDEQGVVHVVDAHLATVARLDADTGRPVILYRSESPPSDGFDRQLRVLREDPDPAVVTDADVARAIRETGRPWSVVHEPTGIEFVLVPPGRYERGARHQEDDTRGDARPVHEVRITRPLYVARTEVTNRQFRTLDPNHVSLLSSHHDLVPGLEGHGFDADAQPATNLCWYDADDFARRWGFRLPTEAEWEYVARAGTQGRYAWGDALEAGEGLANLAGASVSDHVAVEVQTVPWEDGHLVTAPVASLAANGFGLHDTIGNVWEWCADWYAADEYRRCAAGVDDPAGPATGESRVLRGSSWQNPFRGAAAVSYRASTRPTAQYVLSRGVRVVMDP